MPKTKTIAYERTAEPIAEPVTKFGGQPVWIDEPSWPLGTELERPMRFIGQVALGDVNEIFAGKVAYLFMTEDDEDFVDGTFDPEGGENAVVIQPGGMIRVETRPLRSGPTLEERNADNEFEAAEYFARLTERDEPEFSSQEQRIARAELNEDMDENMIGSKVGGSPDFIQNDEFPSRPGEWRLLAQIDSGDIPFELNLGDAGVAYSYVNADASEGVFLWQCC